MIPNSFLVLAWFFSFYIFIYTTIAKSHWILLVFSCFKAEDFTCFFLQTIEMSWFFSSLWIDFHCLIHEIGSGWLLSWSEAPNSYGYVRKRRLWFWKVHAFFHSGFCWFGMLNVDMCLKKEKSGTKHTGQIINKTYTFKFFP